MKNRFSFIDSTFIIIYICFLMINKITLLQWKLIIILLRPRRNKITFILYIITLYCVFRRHVFYIIKYCFLWYPLYVPMLFDRRVMCRRCSDSSNKNSNYYFYYYLLNPNLVWNCQTDDDVCVSTTK